MLLSTGLLTVPSTSRRALRASTASDRAAKCNGLWFSPCVHNVWSATKTHSIELSVSGCNYQKVSVLSTISSQSLNSHTEVNEYNQEMN